MPRHPKSVQVAHLRHALAMRRGGATYRSVALDLSTKRGAFAKNGRARRDAMVSHELARKWLQACQETDLSSFAESAQVWLCQETSLLVDVGRTGGQTQVPGDREATTSLHFAGSFTGDPAGARSAMASRSVQHDVSEGA